MKILPVGAELFHADRQTNMTNLMVAFRNFGKAPKMYLGIPGAIPYFVGWLAVLINNFEGGGGLILISALKCP
jgi:hypothetical protein